MSGKWTLIKRGKGGWCAANDSGCNSSGGMLEDYTYWTGQPCKGYLSEAVEGCIVYDAEVADDAAFIQLVVSGPMLKMELGDRVQRFSDDPSLVQAAAAMRPGLEGAFGTLVDVALSGLSSLDYVGWPVYRKLLEQVGGVRFGKVVRGKVVWE